MKKLTVTEFIQKARKIHGDKYDYSKVDYINARTKICIICPIHGEFWQLASNHLSVAKYGCKECGRLQMSHTKNEFIQKARKIHGDKYDYSKVVYINSSTKICITCPIHGEFWQLSINHITKNGCPKCVGRQWNINDFTKSANLIHGNKYSYDNAIFTGMKKKLIITCPIHGEFWQLASHHVNGCGCPKCKSSRGEALLRTILEDNYIEYVSQKTFDGLTGLGGGKLRYDFYLPKLNMCIEYDGIQHYEKRYEWSDNIFERTKEHDNRKTRYCENNDIELIRIKYTNKTYDNINKIIKDRIRL